MATNTRLAGTASITVNGRTILLVGELTYRVARVARTTLVGMDRVHGYSEMPVAGYIAGTFRDVQDLTLADFNDMIDATVVAKLANGKTIVGTNMWSTDSQEVKAAEATFDVRFEGESVEEL